jgi:hypothetical protein
MFMAKDSSELLGDFNLSFQKFEGLPRLFEEFRSEEFARFNDKKKSERVNQVLLGLIQKAETPCFLLFAVLDYIDQVNTLHILESYAFFHFELWLNQFSLLNQEENYLVRAKIMGKWVPRDAFQILFPIGMGKVYPGSHFVTAHGSPDIDTTVASFWGWVDAFTARVAEGLHLWNVPGGAPTSQVEIGLLFNQMFGEGIFPLLSKTRMTLALSGIDLMTQKGLVCTQTNESTLMVDRDQLESAIVLTDEWGYYLGDWLHFDLESVRQVVMRLNNCLRWLENDLHVKLIALFAKPDLSLKDLPPFIDALFRARLGECPFAQALTKEQKAHLRDYLVKVLRVEQGLDCSLREFAAAMKDLSLSSFGEFVDLVEKMPQSSLFDRLGALIESRTGIFNYLEKIIRSLDDAISSVRSYVERLDVVLDTKSHVFGYTPKHVSYRADVDEIKSKMGNYPYLSVTSTDKNGKLIPMGIVYSSALHKPLLGTVTLRDFCNREETKIPSYLEVISVLDHHKSSLQTSSAPMALIADAQSSNVLCAEMAFLINDRYGTGGMSREKMDQCAREFSADLSSCQTKRLMGRLLQKQVAEESRGGFFVDRVREAVEYIHFLYAILDDTDLLTKVSQRDVECIASLINRLKSIMMQKEVEVISLGDIPRDKEFARKTALRMLQNPDMYSLYRKVYLSKEEAVEASIALCAQGKESLFFADTKEQNSCARVGQAKMFSRNTATFFKHVDLLRTRWHDNILDFVHDRPEVDLHMQMISTVAGAEDVFAGKEKEYEHQDELWIWIPFTEQSVEHLKSFLNALSSSPQMQKGGLSAELCGQSAKAYEQIFTESFLPTLKKTLSEKKVPPIAILKFKAGLINSRKAMISPYLPK